MVRKQTRLGGFFIVCEKTIFFSRLNNELAKLLKISCPVDVITIVLTAASNPSLCGKPCSILLSVDSNHSVQC